MHGHTIIRDQVSHQHKATSKSIVPIIYIQGGPKLGMQYMVYSILYTYFCPTLYLYFTILRLTYLENNQLI